jgi:FkbM family methyltransferase
LTEKPIGGVIITLDVAVLFLVKIFYLAIRILLRIMLGKEKRNHLSLFKKFFIPTSFSLSFYIVLWLHKFLKTLGKTIPPITIIYVPRYNYLAYCPLNKDDFISMTVREDDILSLFWPNEGDLVIDVGAHIGRYTLISSKRIGNQGTVISIEANPIAFEILEKNLRLNNVTNVMTINHAAFSIKTTIKLFVSDAPLNDTLRNTMVSYRAKGKRKYVEVDADTIDNILFSTDLFNESKSVWIKIDVEGAEYEVIQGSIDLLSKAKDIFILIEIHKLEDGSNLYKPIVELLHNYGCRVLYEKTHESGEQHIIAKKGT